MLNRFFFKWKKKGKQQIHYTTTTTKIDCTLELMDCTLELEEKWTIPSKQHELRMKFKSRVDPLDDMLVIMLKGVFTGKVVNLRKDLPDEDPLLKILDKIIESKEVPVAFISHPHIRLGSIQPLHGEAEVAFREVDQQIFGELDDLMFEAGRNLGAGPMAKIQDLVEEASSARRKNNVK